MARQWPSYVDLNINLSLFALVLKSPDGEWPIKYTFFIHLLYDWENHKSKTCTAFNSGESMFWSWWQYWPSFLPLLCLMLVQPHHLPWFPLQSLLAHAVALEFNHKATLLLSSFFNWQRCLVVNWTKQLSQRLDSADAYFCQANFLVFRASSASLSMT